MVSRHFPPPSLFWTQNPGFSGVFSCANLPPNTEAHGGHILGASSRRVGRGTTKADTRLDMTMQRQQPRNRPRTADHACVCTHGTAGDLLGLVPGPAFGIERGDPFVTMSCRAAKTWLCLFCYARAHGIWRPCLVDPSRPELSNGQQQYVLCAHWTVAGLSEGAEAAMEVMRRLMGE